MIQQPDFDPDSFCNWIFNNASFGLLTTNEKLVITNVNHWFEQSSRKEAGQLIGSSVFSIFPEITERNQEHYFHEAMQGASAILSPLFHQYVFRFPSPLPHDDGFMLQLVRISPLMHDSKITGVIALIEDVTEREKREDELKKTNEQLQILNSTKDKFFNIVAHDLRSPFSALLGLSELLVDGTKLSPDQSLKIVNSLHNSLRNQYSFLENLLQWAQLQIDHFELHPKEITCKEIITEVIDAVNLSANSKNISLKETISGPGSLFSDKQSLITILFNLSFNAIKFTPPGGTIEIGCFTEDDHLVFFVKDNGVGIEPEDLKKLFRIETNFTTHGTRKEKGSGLGLILCKEIVEKLGGKIWAESIPAEGSTFFIRIPSDLRKHSG